LDKHTEVGVSARSGIGTPFRFILEMVMGFDPYWQWLHIPQDRRPPTFYDLLGLSAFESNELRIRASFRERYNFVRKYHVGEHEDDAHRLLDELSEAQTCLTVGSRKLAYDDELRRQKLSADGQRRLEKIRADFDPYWQWLRIPKDRRPPNHYDLLGIAPFETDVQGIRDAFHARQTLVSRIPIGTRLDEVSRLIEELAEAHACLVDFAARARYDLRLLGLDEHDAAAADETPCASRFDPYWEWLRIPRYCRPPNYYELLGLPRFESDKNRVYAAFDQRLARVRTHTVGAHSHMARRIAEELSEAQACLADAERRAVYNWRLIEARQPG
jgi:hypothetical protein